MTRRGRTALAALAVLALTGPGTALATGAAPAAGTVSTASVAAAEGPECGTTNDEERTVTGVNVDSRDLHVPEASRLAQRSVRSPGAGVTVVVVDSAFVGFDPAALAGLKTPHGVIVAGIIGGRDQPKPRVDVAIAPGARLVDRPFYNVPRGSDEEGLTPPTSKNLADKLRSIAGEVRSGAFGPRTVVLVPIEMQPSKGLTAAVTTLVDSGALVIAAAGDRAQAGDFLKEFAEGPRPGEDAVAAVAPANHPDVLSIGSSAPEPYASVLRNSGIDLAAPGQNSVSIGLNGGWCVAAGPSTNWAAAQVAGVAALVWSVHRRDDAEKLRARLLATAGGNGGDASPLTGFGVVQPLEALQRAADAAGDADRGDDAVTRGKVPAERADLLAGAREDAVWWGLAGGGALVVLLVLRPVLARRRR